MKIKHTLVPLILLNIVLIAGCTQAANRTNGSTAATAIETPTVPTITVPDAYILIQENTNNPDFVILDVRTQSEFDTGYIAGAINIDYESSQFNTDISQFDKSKQYLVYCRTGIRGAFATQIMMGLGFEKVQNLTGGITAWIQDGYPVLGTATTDLTSTQSITTAPAQLPNGLELQVAVNTTILNPGEALQITVSEYNTLTTTNDLTCGKNWSITGLALGACPNAYVQPFGVTIFKGRYTAQNFSQATPLDIFAPVACPNYSRLITDYIFQPDSMDAYVMPVCFITVATPMSAQVTVNGTYTQGTKLQLLDLGVYTIVAGDEWGNIEFLYFNVE
jgi:rhodanese-related sulfurtransferase